MTLLGWALGSVLRLWLATLRLTVLVDERLDLSSSRPLVLAFWHGEQMALLAWKRRRRTFALVSLSRDGELQRGALGALGLGVERGSSSRGGATGLRAAARRLMAGDDAAFAVDGPRGPLHTVHPGARAAARLGRGWVVPIASAVEQSMVLGRAWDRYRIALPFSRVAVVLGPPLDPSVASDADIGAGIDAAQARAENELVPSEANRDAIPDHARAA